MELEVSGGGRGRGRGGGVPVLPSGMWDALNGTTEKKSYEDFPVERTELTHEESNNDREEYVPTGFGRGRGNSVRDGGGRAGGRGRGDGRGRGGINKDLKGTDWECPSCTNVNWSWRSTCNKCNTSKPMSIVACDEHRDGAGGGFNERQDRASYAAVEIDEDGFDDFGRRVKKLRRADKQAKEEAALNRLSEKYKHLLPVNLVDSVRKSDDDDTVSRTVENNSNSGYNKTSDGRYDDADVSSSRTSQIRRDDRDQDRSAQNSSSRRDERESSSGHRDGGDSKRPRREENESSHHRSSRDDRSHGNGRDDDRRSENHRQGGSGGDYGRERGGGNFSQGERSRGGDRDGYRDRR